MYWLLRDNGDKMSTAGRTREQAENHAAEWAYFFGKDVRFEGPGGDTGVIERSTIFQLDPQPVTKKAFKEKMKQGVTFRAVGCNETGTIFVASTASTYGSAWVAKVKVHQGYIQKIIR